MQQQIMNPTSNRQIKLITDARKLLEKVRSQQLLSADSSFDSSFLFETMHDVGTMKKENGSGEEKLDPETLVDASSSILSSPPSPVKPISVNEDKEPDQSKASNIQPKGVHVLQGSYKRSVDNERKSVEQLTEENMKLEIENYQLNEEMNEFEYKLYCIEKTLGIMEDVGRSSQKGKSYTSANNTTQAQTPKPLPLGVTMDNGDKSLSPVTAAVADAFLEETGVNDHMTMRIRQGKGDTHSTPIFNAQEYELEILRENHEKMVTAIRALAQATIAQTRKHYLYKKRHHMTKKMVAEETEKNNQLMMEKEQLTSEFYETRTNFLKEKDIREILSSEVQDLAKKNNCLRGEKQRHEDMRLKILERVESRDDASSVLSRLSQTSCFPILKTITENTQTKHVMRPRNDKNLEKLVFKLIAQLKKRDDKIDKLEKKLKITMQYLQGALELEVARQDAEFEAQEQSHLADQANTKENVFATERVEI